MKNLFLMAAMMMTFISFSFASNSNSHTQDFDVYENIALDAGKITVKGKNMGSTVTTTINSDGSSTSEVSVDCDNSVDATCYDIEFSPAGLTEVTPNGANPVKGWLLDSDPDNHWYKLLVNQ